MGSASFLKRDASASRGGQLQREASMATSFQLKRDTSMGESFQLKRDGSMGSASFLRRAASNLKDAPGLPSPAVLVFEAHRLLYHSASDSRTF